HCCAIPEQQICRENPPDDTSFRHLRWRRNPARVRRPSGLKESWAQPEKGLQRKQKQWRSVSLISLLNILELDCPAGIHSQRLPKFQDLKKRSNDVPAEPSEHPPGKTRHPVIRERL